MGGVESAMNFMVLFDIFVALYMLYYAIKGSGKLYESGDYPKEMREEHNKMLRKFCWIVGVPLLVLSVLEYTDPDNILWTSLSVGYVLACVMGYVIVFYRRFGKYLSKPKANKPAKTSSKGKKKKK